MAAASKSMTVDQFHVVSLGQSLRGWCESAACNHPALIDSIEIDRARNLLNCTVTNKASVTLRLHYNRMAVSSCNEVGALIASWRSSTDVLESMFPQHRPRGELSIGD